MKRQWTRISAARSATCSSPPPSWPSRITRARPTPSGCGWYWGKRQACPLQQIHPRVHHSLRTRYRPLPCPCPCPPPLWPLANNGEAGKYCCLCGAWFNNPLMAQQHYEGKKHKRNAARARLLEQLAGSLDTPEGTGLRSSYSCTVCHVILNSIEQYHAHLQGSKHQNNLKQHQQ
ncbi:hypothetical protein ANANG_G00306260 [Anguilla anguilla]|uniref:C2H2-type domain-containing protein n=1 Tax=Anguilla anguilla TaxID=7936 RepID=A0A9D3LJV3_ANGAN|nr:hypothetical protein ANANG_G00306260 [Anguilla anguilla]